MIYCNLYEDAKSNTVPSGKRNVMTKKLYVVFKTHLDIGFTDFAANIKEKYLTKYIPAALETARELREAGGDARFVWTTGSWLIHEYVKTLDENQFAEFEKQVKAGDIRWHGLPFTTHTELMDKELFEAGLGLSQELDKLFGVTTIAAKMTDVPGHTRAIVPLLAKTGIEFLHIGVNEGSPVPDVPSLFRWVAPTGEAVTVMYHGDYGNISPLGDTGAALYFAHAGDNMNPPSADDIKQLFSELHIKYPEAEIIASDLSLPALELRTEIGKLPVVTMEIGDSWIHGVGCDPGKVSMFRSLLRYRSTLTDENLRTEFNRRLLLIPEHTWGLDEKTHLADNIHYSKESFYPLRSTAPYIKMEQSWAEQRAYLTDAVSILPENEKPTAEALMNECRKTSVPADTTGYVEVPADTVFSFGDLSFSFGAKGEINHLTFGKKTFADESHPLAQWSYTQFSSADYDRFFSQFIRNIFDWVLEDYNKIGMEKAVDGRHDYSPLLSRVFRYENSVTAIMNFPAEATEKYGCPQWTETTVTPENDGVTVDCAWFGKPANRMAEMLNIGFSSFEKELEISKLGEWIKPDVVHNGNHNLHATDEGIRYPSMSINSLDAPLVSVGIPAILDFRNSLSDTSRVCFNLYNNQWGTNFRMWYDEDSRFRFILSFR